MGVAEKSSKVQDLTKYKRGRLWFDHLKQNRIVGVDIAFTSDDEVRRVIMERPCFNVETEWLVQSINCKNGGNCLDCAGCAVSYQREVTTAEIIKALSAVPYDSHYKISMW